MAQSDRVCKRCFVSGRVQGVFYRVSTANQARALRVTGSAVNLPDGRVEVLAYGKETDVEALCSWLWQGPSGARVTDVVCTTVDLAATDLVPDQFSTR